MDIELGKVYETRGHSGLRVPAERILIINKQKTETGKIFEGVALREYSCFVYFNSSGKCLDWQGSYYDLMRLSNNQEPFYVEQSQI